MYCYRFPDRDAFVTSCTALGWTYEGVVTAYTHDRAVDEVGSVQTLPGAYGEDGFELTPPTFDTRYHVNFRGEPPLEWDQYLINVASPSRHFAGSNTTITIEQLNELRSARTEDPV